MNAIAVRSTDKSVKLDDAPDQRVLNRLDVLYEGGSADGRTAYFATRDLSAVVIGLHRRNWHLFETYKRTIRLDIRSGRTIFRFASCTLKPNKASSWKRVLALAHIRKLKGIII